PGAVLDELPLGELEPVRRDDGRDVNLDPLALRAETVYTARLFRTRDDDLKAVVPSATGVVGGSQEPIHRRWSPADLAAAAHAQGPQLPHDGADRTLLIDEPGEDHPNDTRLRLLDHRSPGRRRILTVPEQIDAGEPAACPLPTTALGTLLDLLALVL